MQSWTEIKKIENPTEEQQLEAVKLNWYAISLIHNPTENVQKAAFAQNVQAILYVNGGPCAALVESFNSMDDESFGKAIAAEPNLLKFVNRPELLRAAIRTDWKIIRKIDNASDELWAEAVRQNMDAFKLVRHPGEATLVAAIEHDWQIIQDVERPSAKMLVAAVKQDYHAYECLSIKCRTEEMQLAAVRADWRCIELVSRPSENVQMEAVKQNKVALRFIKNPAESVVVYCN